MKSIYEMKDYRIKFCITNVPFGKWPSTDKLT